MKRDNINYLVVGIFVLAVMAAFLVVMYKVTGRTGLTDTYYVEYGNVTGVKYGTPVLYEGYQVGQVEEIQPRREGGRTRYVLALAITRDWTIPSDSIATLVASGLLSAITVEIKEGSSTELLEPGEYLQGRDAVGIFNAVNEVAGELQALSRDTLRPMAENLNAQINHLSAELQDLITHSVRPLFDNMNEKLDEKIFSDLTDLLAKLNDSSDRLLVLLDDRNLNNLSTFLDNMKTGSNTFNDLLDRIEETRAAMNGVLIDIDRLVTDNRENLRSAITDLRETLDAVAQNVNAIVYHLEGSSRNVHELSRQLRENPSLILRSSPQTEAGEEK